MASNEFDVFFRIENFLVVQTLVWIEYAREFKNHSVQNFAQLRSRQLSDIGMQFQPGGELFVRVTDSNGIFEKSRVLKRKAQAQ